MPELNTKQVAERLDRPERTITHWCSNGWIECRRARPVRRRKGQRAMRYRIVWPVVFTGRQKLDDPATKPQHSGI